MKRQDVLKITESCKALPVLLIPWPGKQSLNLHGLNTRIWYYKFLLYVSVRVKLEIQYHVFKEWLSFSLPFYAPLLQEYLKDAKLSPDVSCPLHGVLTLLRIF